MGRKSGLRGVNFGSYQKHVAVKITKDLQKDLQAAAEKTGVNVRLVIRDKLDRTYKDYLKASYGPRSPRGEKVYDTHLRKKSTYEKTGTLDEAIDTVIDGDYVRVVVDEDKTYKDPRKTSVAKVIKWLDEGTKGGGKKTGYYKDENGEWHYNYPTPAHLFEAHTRNEMIGFLQSLASDIDNGKYTTYRYTGKKKKRTHYRGNEVR